METTDYSELVKEFLRSGLKIQKVDMKKKEMKEKAENEEDPSVL